jgi:glutathionylspermidine synthase
MGVWLVASKPSGLGIREDVTRITTDDSRFIPHVILD